MKKNNLWSPQDISVHLNGNGESLIPHPHPCYSWENELLVENVDKVWNQARKWILIVYVTTITSLRFVVPLFSIYPERLIQMLPLPYLYHTQHT